MNLARLPAPVAVAVVVLLVGAALLSRYGGPAGLPTEGTIVKVVDGDTVHVTAGGRVHKVRLIGVDTPEAYESHKLEADARRSKQDKQTLMALGRRASEFTRGLCDGRRCRLEYDQANAARGHRDRYKRLLAFVWVSGEAGSELLVNAEIIRQGYGQAMTRYPFDEVRKEQFRELEREAREQKLGLWADWRP